MNVPLVTRYALRSLLRHKRRTFLSVAGVAVGCALCLFLVSFIRGEGEMIMRAAAESGTGHLRMAPEAWLETREEDARLDDWTRLLTAARATEGVAVAAPHARTDALLAMGTRSTGVVMVGVDPEVEPDINRLVRSVTEGEYLVPGDMGTVVIGKVVAKRLDVGVGDDLMVTASGQGGEMRSAMLRVRGLVSTGSEQLDGGLCHVLLADLANVSGYDGAAEISILLHEPKRIESVTAALQPHLAQGAVLVTWEEIMPELAQGVKVDETFSNLMIGVVGIVVFLGIASAQLAAVLERRKEFAVLSAIGMKGGRLVRVMLAEGAILGVAGAVMALLVATPLVYAISVYGINFASLYGDMDLAMSSILMDPVIFGDFGWWILPLAFGLSLGATLLSSLYPAWYALGTDPATALRVEE